MPNITSTGKVPTKRATGRGPVRVKWIVKACSPTASGRPHGTSSSQALATEHVVARTTLGAAADRLADQGHLVRDRAGTRLVDPLVAEWLRRR